MADKPKRIQRSRTSGWRMPAEAVYVGRPTIFGNPYNVMFAMGWQLNSTERPSSTICDPAWCSRSGAVEPEKRWDYHEVLSRNEITHDCSAVH